VIIWRRWGILSFLAIGVGTGLAFGLIALFCLPSSGRVGDPLVGALVCAGAGLVNWALVRWVYSRTDRPRPVTVTRRIAEPHRQGNGSDPTELVLPVVDEFGRPVMAQPPPSALFFIPVQYVTFVYLAMADIFAVAVITGLVTGA